MSDASGKKKKGGKKGKKGGQNKGKKAKSLDAPKDDSPPSLLEFHLHNKPVADSPTSRDEDIARFQNEAAVLEKSIREITTKIEKDVRERQAFKGKRQEAYEAMNAARDVLQARKADKDKVYQRIQQYRNSRNSLRGDRSGNKKGRNFRTIRELDQAIAQLERDMQTEVLTLGQEKAKMREIKELSKMRPDVQKISRQNEVLQQFTESTKDQQDEDQAAYKTLKASVQEAYTIQQGKYELFQEAVAADEELNMAIDASIENRKASYARQKDIRQLISARKRDYQKSQRDVQRWDQQTRKLKREVDFYNRQIQRAERDRKREEQQAAWKAQQAARDAENANAQQAEQPKDAQQRQNRRPERDDTAAKSENDGPRPPRTTRPPRERQQRKPRVQKVYSAPVQKDALETQKFQLNAVIAYVKTLLPSTGESAATSGQWGKGPGGGAFNSHKGGFKPSRDGDLFGDDLFSNNRKSKKSKRKKKKKTKNVFFVQSHTPPTVMDAFKSLRRWLGNSGYPATIALPMKPAEAEGCIKSLSEVEKFLVDYDPSKPAATKPDAAEPTEEAPEQSEAQPEAAEPEQKDDQPTDAVAEESAAQPESLPSAPAPDAEPQPSDTQEADAGADATEVSADTATDADADALNTQQPEAANAQPEDDATEKDAAAVDLKPEQPDTTVKDNDDAAPAQATNENPDDEDDDSDDDDDEDDESSDGVEVMESMVI